MKLRNLLGASLFLCMGFTLLGCSSSGKSNIIDTTNISNTDNNDDKTESYESNAFLDLHESKEGQITFEVVDTYVTDNPKKNGVVFSKTRYHESIQVFQNDEYQQTSYPDYIADVDSGQLIDSCKMLVCQIKVKNIDAISLYKDEYNNPYMFNASGIYLSYLENEKVVKLYNIDYFSEEKDGDHTWATFELKPGETITYEVGFVVGNVIDSDEGEPTVIPAGDYSHFYLANTSGDASGDYYKIDWKER